MTFRTPDEAVALANNTRYGLAASVWSENINLALDSRGAAQGRRGLDQLHQPVRRRRRLRRLSRERLRPRGRARRPVRISRAGWEKDAPALQPARRGAAQRRAVPHAAAEPRTAADRPHGQALHRRQAGAADSGYSYSRASTRRAERSARPASATARTSATPSRPRTRPTRLGRADRRTTARRCSTTSPRISRPAPPSSPAASAQHDRRRAKAAAAEVEASIARIFFYAAWADKYDGRVHATALAPCDAGDARAWGVMGILCPDEAPLLGFVSLVMPAIAMGNRVVACRRRATRSPRPTSTRCSTPATCRTAWSTSSPASATCWPRPWPSTTRSPRSGIFGRPTAAPWSRAASAGNLKAHLGQPRPAAATGFRDAEGQGRDFLRHATQVKNIWVPYGE